MRLPDNWQPDPNGPESKQPLLFIHGLGMGMAQYASLLNYMSKAEHLKDRPIVVLIQPHISMSFFDRDYLKPPENKTCVKELIELAAVSRTCSFYPLAIPFLIHSSFFS